MPSENTHLKQRLAIFLDGTWNTQDDSTNILHGHALTFEGMSEDGYLQKRYYDRGVGTGVFESILGGGFGVGLEVNVREAYNWLVDNYNDGDEIYIFGFSRGAYSARSLVGFIAFCGLIRRGAPLTNSQLWDGYVKLSRARGGTKTLLEKIGTKIKPPFRKIKDIKKGDEKNTTTENLLKEWSRRVDITYLGIFDTVGAMGLEALGIQGLRSKSGMNHNQHPTALIQKCRHALAIDEYRSSFRLTPFLHYVPNSVTKKVKEKEGYRKKISQKWFLGAHSNIGGGYNDNLLAYYPLRWILDGAKAEGLNMKDLTRSEFPAKIDQINDSYKDFTGIVWPHIFREKRHYRQINQSDIVVAGIYTKRDKKTRYSNLIENGFTLTPIYEEIDQSVLELILAENDKSYVSPNLKNYANRILVKEIPNEEISEKALIEKEIKTLVAKENSNKEINAEATIDKIIKTLVANRNPNEEINEKSNNDKILKILLADRNPKEKWLEKYAIARVILVCWSTLAAIGISFLLDSLLINTSFLSWEYIAIIALVFSISDCAEFHFNLKTGLNSYDVVSKVALNVLMWIRLLGIVFFFFGTIAFSLQCIDWGLSPEMTIEKIIDLVQEKNWYLIPFFPMAAVLILDLFYNGLKDENGKINSSGVLTKIAATIFSPFVFIIFGFTITYFSGFLSGFSLSEMTATSVTNLVTKELAGQLLIIQFLFLILNYTFRWVGKPTRRARLGFAITSLQSSYTPDMIEELFDVMRYNISQLWAANTKKKRDSNAWRNVKMVVRESLWRDILGFIPIYTFVFGAIIWLASTYGQHENWGWLSEEKKLDIPLWIWIISITALADYIENIVHLRHVNNYPKSKSSVPLVATGIFFTIIKSIGFVIALILSTLIFINLSVDILAAEPGGWQWLIAVLITLILMYIFGSLMVKFVREKLKKEKN